MAQTKKRRKRKHRGTPAGTIEARGRTGRKPTAGEVRPSVRDRRAERLSKPPSWRGSLNRAAIAALLFGVVVVVAFGQPVASGVALAAVMVLLYVPMTYYMDLFMYRRHQRRLAERGR